jgi:ribosome maturation factor RimP
MAMEDAVRAKLDEILEGTDNFLVELRWNPVSSKLLVVIDADSGVDIDRIAEITRALNDYLDEEMEDCLENAFTLEVSTPGLDRPLSSLRQYRKNKGRQVRIMDTEGRTWEGKLAEVGDEGVVVQSTTKEKTRTELAFKEIKQTKVLP